MSLCLRSERCFHCFSFHHSQSLWYYDVCWRAMQMLSWWILNGFVCVELGPARSYHTTPCPVFTHYTAHLHFSWGMPMSALHSSDGNRVSVSVCENKIRLWHCFHTTPSLGRCWLCTTPRFEQGLSNSKPPLRRTCLQRLVSDLTGKAGMDQVACCGPSSLSATYPPTLYPLWAKRDSVFWVWECMGVWFTLKTYHVFTLYRRLSVKHVQ